MPRASWAIAFALISAVATAENFGARFEKGYSQLRHGEPEAALASFNELLTETPDSELVRYSIAAAEYGKGVKDLDAGQADAGVQGLNHARADFEALKDAKTSFVRNQATYGAANCAAQLAAHYNDGEQYNQRLQALQNAVADYESVLAGDPKHAAAATNLNHTRYLLKKMLQHPPENKKKKDDKGDDGEKGQQKQPGDQGEQPQDQEKKDEQQDQKDQNDPSDQKPGEPKDQKSTAKSAEDQNIQAILDSLEDKNREEQKNLRKAKGAPKVLNGKWW